MRANSWIDTNVTFSFGAGSQIESIDQDIRPGSAHDERQGVFVRHICLDLHFMLRWKDHQVTTTSPFYYPYFDPVRFLLVRDNQDLGNLPATVVTVSQILKNPTDFWSMRNISTESSSRFDILYDRVFTSPISPGYRFSVVDPSTGVVTGDPYMGQTVATEMCSILLDDECAYADNVFGTSDSAPVGCRYLYVVVCASDVEFNGHLRLSYESL